MPTATYEQLLSETMPSRIDKFEQYRRIGAQLGDLIGRGSRRSPEETKLMRLLAVIVEDYDRRHSMPPDKSTPAEMLQFLLDHSGKPTAALAPIFGQRSHIHEALTGKRPISADQARKLGKLFNVAGGLFI